MKSNAGRKEEVSGVSGTVPVPAPSREKLGEVEPAPH